MKLFLVFLWHWKSVLKGIRLAGGPFEGGRDNTEWFQWQIDRGRDIWLPPGVYWMSGEVDFG